MQNGIGTATATEWEVERKRRMPYKWEMLLLLWFSFFLHLVGRQIFNNLLPLIKAELDVSDVQLGLVAAIYTAIIGVGVMIGGYAADAWRRKWIITLSLVVWSVATLLTGLSTGLITLLIFRGVASGGGEAFACCMALGLFGFFVL